MTSACGYRPTTCGIVCANSSFVRRSVISTSRNPTLGSQQITHAVALIRLIKAGRCAPLGRGSVGAPRPPVARRGCEDVKPSSGGTSGHAEDQAENRRLRAFQPRHEVRARDRRASLAQDGVELVDAIELVQRSARSPSPEPRGAKVSKYPVKPQFSGSFSPSIGANPDSETPSVALDSGPSLAGMTMCINTFAREARIPVRIDPANDQASFEVQIGHPPFRVMRTRPFR